MKQENENVSVIGYHSYITLFIISSRQHHLLDNDIVRFLVTSGKVRPPDHYTTMADLKWGSVLTNHYQLVALRKTLMCEFGEKLPDGLHETIHKTVTTMVAAKKHVNVGGTKVYDMNIIYSRVIGLQASGRDFDIKDVLSYELAPVPTSMFETTGESCNIKVFLKATASG